MIAQPLMYRFCLVGAVCGFLLPPLLPLEMAISTPDLQQSKELIARGNRPKLAKPGGTFGDLAGGILIRGGTILAADDNGFVVKFNNKIDFQAQVWDPRVGTNDGDGIEQVEFEILDENGNSVHKRVEKRSGYCPFGGGEPRCNLGQLPKNHRYKVQIQSQPKNPAAAGAFWFFELQT
jgi:hypothetical protein